MKFSLPLSFRAVRSRVTRRERGGICLRWRHTSCLPSPHPHHRRLDLGRRRRSRRPLQRPRPSHDVYLRMRPGPARMQPRRLPVFHQDARPVASRARQGRQRRPHLARFRARVRTNRNRRPTTTGFNRVAWIMPFLVLALGIAFAVHIVRSWKNRPEPALADGIIIRPGSDIDEFRRQARKETDL